MAEQKKRTTELDVDFSLTDIEEAIPVEEVQEVVEEEVVEEEELDPKKKKLYIIIGSVVISMVLAVVVYFVFIKEDAPPPPKEEKVVEEEEPIEIVEQEEYIPPISYVVSPFLIPLSNDDGKVTFLHVSVELILSNEYVIKDLDKNITALRQNLLYVFKSKTAENFQDLSKKAVLKQEIITAANRVLQRGTIYEVNFMNFSVL